MREVRKMFNFTFNNNGTQTTQTFEKAYDLIRFVATSRIKDEDFVGMNFGERQVEGIDGLCNYAMEVADQMEIQEAMMEQMIEIANMESEEDEEEEADLPWGPYND